ncbi:MAG TPA: DUF6036 family nucleotidyltransferase [Candidatus Sulfomarinibacteraceae bacterium]|nr:DUF6036 family nucleotidyltransferase [Candidatus Sulfomarinibacteraceae bacterium]
MPRQTIEAGAFSRDVLEFLKLLEHHRVRCMIVGGEAVIFYGHIRFTGDIDVFFDRSPSNAHRLFSALQDFWKQDIPGIDDPSRLQDTGAVFQFGLPPNRIDLLNDIDGIDFEGAWPRRTEVLIEHESGSFSVAYIGLDDLIENKKASGRPKDLDDLPYLIAAGTKRMPDE